MATAYSEIRKMEDKQQKIIEGAYNIFIKHGIRNVSMDEMSRMLGISKKTLYQVVSNKTDLLEKIGAYIRDSIAFRVEEIKEKDLNAIDCLLEMSKVSSEKHFRLHPILTFEIRKFYPHVYEKYLTHKKEIILNHIIENIDQGIKEGFYRSDLNKEIVAHLYFQKIEDFQGMEEDEIQNYSFTKVFEVMFENHIRGISNQKGIEYFEKQKAKLNFNI